MPARILARRGALTLGFSGKPRLPLAKPARHRAAGILLVSGRFRGAGSGDYAGHSTACQRN